jgi:hypothetical protein
MAVKLSDGGILWTADNTVMINKSAIFPADTVWTFFQSTTPIGWTRVSYTNDSMLRVISDIGGGGTNGGVSPFTTVFSNSSKTFTTNVGPLNSGPTTLSTSTIPAHTHSITGQSIAARDAVNPDGEYTEGNLTRVPSGLGIQPGGTTGATGGGGSHVHQVTFSSSNFFVNIPLSVQYINVFFASFNG